MRYVVEIFQDDARMGAGFFVMPQYVLTARHCLPANARDDDAFTVRGPGEVPLPGLLRLPSGDADLALIEIVRLPDVPVQLLTADKSRHGDQWASPYRPGEDDPLLSGMVSEPLVPFLGANQWSFEAMQLKCHQVLGDYSGYSGSPVERSDAGDPTLLGILLEQYPDRQDHLRNTDVLFAATIKDALGRFERLAVGHLLRVLMDEPDGQVRPSSAQVQRGTQLAASVVPSLAKEVEGLEAYSDWLQKQVEAGYLDMGQARELTHRVARKVAGP